MDATGSDIVQSRVRGIFHSQRGSSNDGTRRVYAPHLRWVHDRPTLQDSRTAATRVSFSATGYALFHMPSGPGLCSTRRLSPSAGQGTLSSRPSRQTERQ